MVSPRLIAVGLALSLCCGPAALGEETVWATGRVCSAQGHRPLPNALVAVYDDKGRVVDYARTDPDGYYAVAVPRHVLHLEQHSPDIIHRVARGVSNMVGGVVGAFKAGAHMAVNATPLDPLTKTGINAATGAAADLVMGKPHKQRKLERGMPGTLLVKVTHPGNADAIGLDRVYWMQDEPLEERGHEKRVVTAWMDPVNLERLGSEKASSLTSNYFTFTDVRLEPSIAEPGQRVRLTVTMPSPPEPSAPVVVVARNAKNKHMLELRPIGKGRYEGEFVVDSSFPHNDQSICAVAYAEQEDGAGRNPRAEKAIQHAGLWNPDHPYVYNPLYVVSRNRAEAILTVVNPRRRWR